MTNHQFSVINFRGNQKSYKKVTKGDFIISTKNKIVSIILAIAFLFSIPVYAYADDNSQTIQVAQSESNLNLTEISVANNLNGFYDDHSEFNFTADDITYNSAVLNWSSENLYISYTIYKFNIILNSYEEYAVTTANSLELNDLSQLTEYSFAITSTASGEELGKVSFKTDEYVPPVEHLVEMGLPSVSGSCKTYAYYTAVTLKSSPAYAVLNSGYYNGEDFETYTDEETGIRMVGDCYCAALGSYYGTVKGTRYKITLSTGKTFKIILCDQKADRHTDGNNQYAVRNKDVVEFYVQKGHIPSNVRGNYNALDQFNGDIVKIEKYI